MNLAELDLNLLVAFEAMLEERSVTKAARRVGMGQPSMSEALGRLRALFRDELFVRASGAMQPTPKALRIAPGVQAALHQLRATLGEQVPFDPSGARQAFTVAATDYASLVLLPTVAARLRDEAPQVDMHVLGYEKSGVGAMLARGEADVALGVFPQPPGEAVSVPLFEERFVGVARRGHPALQGGASPDAAAFAALPHALVTVRQDRSGALDEALARLGLRRRIAVTLPHMLVLPALLQTSDLVAALPGRVAHGVLAAGLEMFEIPVATPSWLVAMLWNPAARTDQATAWLRRCIQDAAATA